MKNILIILTVIFICFSKRDKCFSQQYGYGDDFHEFITKFTQEKDFQFNNISFPLLTISKKDTILIEKTDWDYIDYCFGCEYSSILFMNDTINSQAGYYKIVNNTDFVISVYILNEKEIRDFHFYQAESGWKLNKLYFKGINSLGNESFFDFIDVFAVDTGFVKRRLSDNFTYFTWLDSPNIIIDVPIEMKWFSGMEFLYKRIYINNYDLESDEISLLIKGEGTGYYLEYYFERIDKKWFLVKLVNIGV